MKFLFTEGLNCLFQISNHFMLQQLITEMKNLMFSSEEEGFTEDDTQQLKQVTPDTMISLNIQCILFVELNGSV